MSVKYGIDKDLERLADQILNEGVKPNDRSTSRDIEKMSYEHGFISEDELEHYDPANDWDTHDSVRTLVVDPVDIDLIRPTITDDDNIRGSNPLMGRRQLLMRHVWDTDDWGSAEEEIPLLGANEGPRKSCSRCKKIKGLQYFSPRRKNGFHSWCKVCRKEWESEKYHNRRSEC